MGQQGSATGSMSGSMTCQAVPACGGEIVGTWRLDGVCYNAVSNVIPSCPSSSFDGVIDNASGQWVFSADGQYTRDYGYMGSLTLQVPQACVPSGQDCSVYATASRSCSQASSGCQCDQVVDVAEGQMAQITLYSTAGTTLDIRGVATFDYCVQADKLHLTRRPNPSAIGGVPEPMPVLTLTRQ